MAETTVLYVDDDPANRHLLVRLFGRKRPDDRVLVAATGGEALEMADQNDFDLVLLDLTLPDLSGEEVLKTLKAEHQMPVVIISGHDDPVTKERLAAAGAAGYLAKPFDATQLFTLVEETLAEQP